MFNDDELYRTDNPLLSVIGTRGRFHSSATKALARPGLHKACSQ